MMKLLTALVLIEALLLIWVFAVEPRLLRVSRYQLEAPDMKGLKMVFASDFHLIHLQFWISLVLCNYTESSPSISCEMGFT